MDENGYADNQVGLFSLSVRRAGQPQLVFAQDVLPNARSVSPVPDLTPNVEYEWRVTAKNEGGETSTTASFWTQAKSPQSPSPPATARAHILTLDITPGSVEQEAEFLGFVNSEVKLKTAGGYDLPL